MSTLSLESVKRISVGQYHRMIENGILGSDDRLELLDGYLVNKAPNSPLHASTVQILLAKLWKLFITSDQHLRVQGPTTLSHSETEPDIAVVWGSHRDYLERHPQPADVLVLIEVADSSLKQDQTTKQEIYGRAGIVNLVQKIVEVYTQPSGPQAKPVYKRREVFTRQDTIPLEMESKIITTIPGADIFP